MTVYGPYWVPQSEAEARFQIDTSNATEAGFWEGGARHAEITMAWAPDPCRTVLDYGCGIGRVLRHIDAPRRIGVDVSAEMLDYAAANVPDAELLRGDGRSIPVDTGSVDYAYSWLTLQHMDAADVVAVLREVVRVLRPGGRAWLQFTGFGQRWEPGGVLKRGPCHWPGHFENAYHEAHTVFEYRPDLIRRLAGDAGLIVEAIDPLGSDTERYWVLRGRR